MAFSFQDKPLSGDILATSQGDLKQNFDYLQAVLGGVSPIVKDHQIGFKLVTSHDSSTLGEGRHNSVGLIDNGVPNFPTDGITDFIYATAGNIFFKTVANVPIQLTNVNVGAPSAIQNKGYTFLPGGIMLCWGTQLATATNPIVFPNSGFSTVFVATGCTSANDRAFAITSLLYNQFTYSVNNPTGVTIYWYAIGAK